MPKERKTAAPPSPALETVPADTLTKPAEKTPDTQPPEAPHISYSFPTSVSDIEAMLARLVGAKQPAPAQAAPPDDAAAKAPAADQKH